MTDGIDDGLNGTGGGGHTDRTDDELGPLRAFLTATVPEVESGSRPPTVMLVAFEGWNDAGQAATGAVQTLAGQWEAFEREDVCSGEYYDFQVTRPTVRRDADGRGILAWPALHVQEAVLDGDGLPTTAEDCAADGLKVLLCSGVEPNLRWRAFTAELLETAAEEHVDALVVLGSLLADVPHTRPLPAQVSSPQPELRMAVGAERPTYEGPTGIVGVVADTAAGVGLPTLSVWGMVPHYVAQAPSPTAQLAVVEALEELLGVTVDTGSLQAEAALWRQSVDEAAQEDEQIAAYVQQLEEATDASALPEASGDAIAQELERYLRGRGGS